MLPLSQFLSGGTPQGMGGVLQLQFVDVSTSAPTWYFAGILLLLRASYGKICMLCSWSLLSKSKFGCSCDSAQRWLIREVQLWITRDPDEQESLNFHHLIYLLCWFQKCVNLCCGLPTYNLQKLWRCHRYQLTPKFGPQTPRHDEHILGWFLFRFSEAHDCVIIINTVHCCYKPLSVCYAPSEPIFIWRYPTLGHRGVGVYSNSHLSMLTNSTYTWYFAGILLLLRASYGEIFMLCSWSFLSKSKFGGSCDSAQSWLIREVHLWITREPDEQESFNFHHLISLFCWFQKCVKL